MLRRALLPLVLLIAMAVPSAAGADSATRTTGDVGPPTPSRAQVDRAAHGAEDAALGAWRAGRLVLLGAVAVVAIGAVGRLVVRRRRRVVRLTLVPFRSQQADPENLRRMLESWHQQLLARWWRRIP